MSDIFKRMMIRKLIPLVSEYLPLLDPAIQEYKDSVKFAEKDNLAPGDDVVAIIYTHDSVTRITVAVLNAKNVVVRQIHDMTFAEFISMIFSSIKSEKNADTPAN